jgi:UDP-N-acetylglucosamine transferase subunit ALG13
MIFVTVGTQLPFDRMVKTVDAWAGKNKDVDVFGQIGPTDYEPRHFAYAQFLDAPECRRRIEQASVVVAHAGMGTILTALELGKPVVVMPRRADLGEHRNEHQLSTARNLLAQGRVIVAMDEVHLVEKLQNLNRLTDAGQRIGRFASPSLISAIERFIHHGERPATARPCVDDTTATVQPPQQNVPKRRSGIGPAVGAR